MYKRDSLPIGLFIGCAFNIVLTLIIWLIVDIVGFAPIEVPGKLYFLAVIPAVFIMRTAMKKHQLGKMGSGILLSIILFVVLFFIALNKNWI